MKFSLLTLFSWIVAQTCLLQAAPAAIIIADSFNGLPAGTNINGRTPDVNLINSNNWVAATSTFLANGTGALSADTTNARTAALDLGAGYLAAIPGIYELSLTITQPTVSSQSWIALGFSQSNVVTDNLVGNQGNPWLLFRLNGNVNVYGGPNTQNQLTNGGITGAATVTATREVPHVFSLLLDTSLPNWTLNAAIDGTPIDVNGSLAGLAYTFATNPTTSRYVAMSVGTNGTNAIGTVDNFQLSFPPIPEPSTTLLWGIAIGAGIIWRRRR